VTPLLNAATYRTVKGGGGSAPNFTLSIASINALFVANCDE
jgi:hypothetical protein